MSNSCWNSLTRGCLLLPTVCGPICHNSLSSFEKCPLKEYDENMIVKIYKSVMLLQGQLVPRDAPKLSLEIV